MINRVKSSQIVSVKVSLKEATVTKQRHLAALLSRVRSLTGRYIRSLWEIPGKLDKETMDRIPCGHLSYRHRSNCLKVALEIVVATKRSAKAIKRTASCPGPPRTMRLSSLVCRVETGKGAFDYVLKISGLVSGNPIVVPFKSHKVINEWLDRGGTILNGASVNENFAYLWIKIPHGDAKFPGEVLAVDAGINKLLVDSKGQHYGKDCRNVLDKVRRCKPGSKGKQRAIATRRDYMNRVVKQLPWDSISCIAHEDLTGIKLGKKSNRGKSFRKLIAPWTIRQVFTRIAQLAQRNRVRVVVVDPRNTSRTCPACRHCASENRKAEVFKCVNCGHRQDADEVGALNILDKALKTLGSVWSPGSLQPETALS